MAFAVTGALSAADAKKSWKYEKKEDGSLRILKYKGKDSDVFVPAVIGKNTVTEIGNSAFHGCESLTSITIPESVTEIRDYAFYGCESLTSITIPESVTEIGWDAFSGCESLASITIPESVTEIGDEAFYGCKSLTSITIPESVTKIGYEVFSRCKNLTIHAPAGSYAEKYAKENKIPFAAE